MSYSSGTQDAAKRQSGDAATRWPITILLSNGSVLEPLESKMVIGNRFAASCVSDPLFLFILLVPTFSHD